QDHLASQKEKLKKFGAVNLLALEEYRETSEREKFLSEQIDDLQSAKNDLLATISKINVTAKELFAQTFDKVRVNFQNLFVELFSGGEAELKLLEPDDPLESAIEIVARPRGKKLLSIAQMSGGERALTAISLLFALYLVKPSPFCILDEIDAPLDDANCHRFLKMIRSFSDQTQFVIITHNKITMEAADNLYGITMEMPGVSKLVAVRFTDNGDLDSDLPETEELSEADVDIPPAVVERLTPSLKVDLPEEEQLPEIVPTDEDSPS
ncbi:MAG: AAA family ATPase, partial [candidate division Zixibacteria bacterium]